MGLAAEIDPLASREGLADYRRQQPDVSVSQGAARERTRELQTLSISRRTHADDERTHMESRIAPQYLTGRGIKPRDRQRKRRRKGTGQGELAWG
jgi:hypothetical protein